MSYLNNVNLKKRYTWHMDMVGDYKGSFTVCMPIGFQEIQLAMKIIIFFNIFGS